MRYALLAVMCAWIFIIAMCGYSHGRLAAIFGFAIATFIEVRRHDEHLRFLAYQDAVGQLPMDSKTAARLKIIANG